jgi:hypothetical protein
MCDWQGISSFLTEKKFWEGRKKKKFAVPNLSANHSSLFLIYALNRFCQLGHLSNLLTDKGILF